MFDGLQHTNRRGELYFEVVSMETEATRKRTIFQEFQLEFCFEGKDDGRGDGEQQRW